MPPRPRLRTTTCTTWGWSASTTAVLRVPSRHSPPGGIKDSLYTCTTAACPRWTMPSSSSTWSRTPTHRAGEGRPAQLPPLPMRASPAAFSAPVRLRAVRMTPLAVPAPPASVSASCGSVRSARAGAQSGGTACRTHDRRAHLRLGRQGGPGVAGPAGGGPGPRAMTGIGVRVALYVLMGHMVCTPRPSWSSRTRSSRTCPRPHLVGSTSSRTSRS